MYSIEIESLAKTRFNARAFGEMKRVAHVRLVGPLTAHVTQLCLAYEELLRAIFPECHNFRSRLNSDSKRVYLNCIDLYSSKRIEAFLASPSSTALMALHADMRAHRGTPDFVTLVTCRNLGLDARRVISDTDHLRISQQRSQFLNHRVRPSSQKQKELSVDIDRSSYIEVIHPPMILHGQSSPLCSPNVASLLADKKLVYEFLLAEGLRTPTTVEVDGLGDLRAAFRRFRGRIILKPAIGSNRFGVVGPITAWSALEASYASCVRQTAERRGRILAQQYIRGSHVRINVNHGRITFVARSIRTRIRGDGSSTIRTLCAKLNRPPRLKSTFIRIESVLVGQGLSLSTILPPGKRLEVSLDGNDNGRFEDITNDFEAKYRRSALGLSRVTHSPVLGIDAIVDRRGRLWFLDLNTNPALDFFRSPERAYQTMNHMIRSLVSEVGSSAG
jgi:hypothetical protein